MGPESRKWRERFEKSVLVSTHDDFSPVIVGGKGVHVIDVDGNSLIETNSQVGIASLGHNHPVVINALMEYLTDSKNNLTAVIGSDYIHPKMVELAEELIRITPGSHPKMVGFKAGGGEAIDSTWKFFRKVRPERPFFVSFFGAFHGRIGASLQLTCSKYVQKDGYERSGFFIKSRYNRDIDYLREVGGCDFSLDQIGAVYIEFVQGEGGIVPADPAWVNELMAFCKEYSIKLVDDEIQTGLGRTGKMWACEHYGVIPDILVTSKALGAGQAIAAFIVDAGMINDNLKKGWDSETSYAPPKACVNALATIKTIEKEKLLANVRWMGEILGQRLRVFEKRFPQYYRVRGLGLMWGLEFILNDKPDPESRDKFLKKAVDDGLLVMGAGRGIPAKNPTVRFLFPLCITKEEIDMVMNKVEKILLYSHP